jgi:16S rRNA (uracil1498-N3)-methyltransferase
MRISRFYIDSDLFINQQLELSPLLINYISNVLRLKPGAEITLFNDQGGEYTATLNEVQKRYVSVSIHSFIDSSIESSLKIHLFQGISRSERMDYSIQKAIELGVHSITPVFTQRSNAKLNDEKRLSKKQQHWQGVAISACEQSGRTQLVTINPPIKVSQLEQFPADLRLLLDPDAKLALSNVRKTPPLSVNIFIGPEGGLNVTEIELAIKQQYQAIQLGPRTLRTETAGMTIISILQYLWGDLG